MPHYNQSSRQSIADINLGMRVDKPTATLPAGVAGALFNVIGGRVAILGGILGEVTTVIQTQANNTKLVANPTVGTSVDLCTVLDISADEVGCLYGVTGNVGDALVGADAGYAPLPEQPLVVAEGTIDLNCAATSTGSVKWSIWYVPVDDGAYIEAA